MIIIIRKEINSSELARLSTYKKKAMSEEMAQKFSQRNNCFMSNYWLISDNFFPKKLEL